jgi:DNA repair protein RAD5
LLNKFKRNTVGIQEESTAFVKEVAQGLSQVVGSSEDCLKTECPICFEEPNITEAVHTPCAHMFCKKCLLDEFHEQQIRGKKQGPCKAKVEGGDCPVCHAYVKISRVILIKRSNDEMVPTYLSEEPCGKENVPLTHAQQRDEAARVALESALANGASSAKLEAVLMELDAVWEANPGSKILIFSQFLGFLDIVTRALNQRGK